MSKKEEFFRRNSTSELLNRFERNMSILESRTKSSQLKNKAMVENGKIRKELERRTKPM